MNVARHLLLALALALALSPLAGCVLYFGNDTDGGDDIVADAGFTSVDARPQPDAPPPGCEPAQTCGTAVSGRLNLCGNVFDVETTAPIESPRLAVRFYDSVAYATNPSTAPQLALDSFAIDSCGRFVAMGLQPGASQQVLLTIDDLPSAPDDHRLTALATYSFPGAYANLRAYVLRRTTDAAWSTAAGLVGPSFADQGAILATYGQWSGPTAGVTPTRNGVPVPADDYTFSDASSGSRSTLAPGQSLTGADGSALFLHSMPRATHSGTGVVEPTCTWDVPGSVAIPNTLTTLEIQAFCKI